LKNDRVYLLHIRDAIALIETYSSAGKNAYLAAPEIQDAIIRRLEVIGEASERLSLMLREAHPDVPWRRICGLRDVLIHDYMAVDVEAVWAVVESGILRSKSVCTRFLRSRDPQRNIGTAAVPPQHSSSSTTYIPVARGYRGVCGIPAAFSDAPSFLP
jgi:uncharacterized protein with HEPN domain